MLLKLQLNGQTHTVEVIRQGNQVRVRVGDRSLEGQLLHQADAFLTLAHGSERWRMAGHVQGDQRQVWVNGRMVNYERLRENQSTPSAATGSLSASIPAVVAQVLVAVGDRVETGDKLILLESMKMIIPIQAHEAGIVTHLHCAPGDAVQPGIPLAELKPA